jgi:hypothetical protein
MSNPKAEGNLCFFHTLFTKARGVSYYAEETHIKRILYDTMVFFACTLAASAFGNDIYLGRDGGGRFLGLLL